MNWWNDVPLAVERPRPQATEKTESNSEREPRREDMALFLEGCRYPKVE